MPFTRPLSAGLLAILCLAVVGCGGGDDKPAPAPPAAPAPAADTPVAPDAPDAPADPAPTPASTEPQPVALWNGTDLTGWQVYGHEKFNKWTAGKATVTGDALTAEPGGDDLVQPAPLGVNLYTQREFTDFFLKFDVMLPPGGNSGVYLLGEYELQLLHDPAANADAPTDMDFGAISRLLTPQVNAFTGPGQWQSVEVEFRAPRFDEAGKKIANARLPLVKINGKTVHENVEIPEPTGGGLYSEDPPSGPIMIQGNEGPAAFRNIVITPLN